MSDIFDDGPGGYEATAGYGTNSPSTDMFGDPITVSAPAPGGHDAELKVEHPPAVYLAVAAALAITSAVLYFVDNWKLSIVGYISAVLVILASGWFQQKDRALHSRSRHYAPLLWAAKATVALILVGFVAAVGNVTRIAHELATRYTLFCIAALLAISAAGAGLTINASPASAQLPAQVASTNSEVSAVYSGFLGCVSTGRTGLVQVIVDESESLRKTDRADQRVPALQSSLQTLDAARRNQGLESPIEVMLAGFGVGYEVRTDWTTLDDRTLPVLLESVSEFADRDGAFDTDYYLALDGADTSFAAKSNEIETSGSEAPCQMLFWITDGEYSIEPRYNAGLAEANGTSKPYAPDLDLRNGGNPDKVELIGGRLICKPGGTIDSLRADGTSVIAVTLAAPDDATDDATDYSLVAAASTGSPLSSGGSCGARDATGALISAQDPAKLSVSPGSKDIEFPYDFSIIDLDARFTLDIRWPLSAGTQTRASGVTLSDPKGETILIPAPESGSQDGIEANNGLLGRHDVRWTWLSDGWLHLETGIDQGSGAGDWKTTFTGTSRPIVSMLPFPGYRLDKGQVSELRPGEHGTAEVVILGVNGERLGSGVLKQLDLSLDLRMGDETTPLAFQPTADQGYRVEFELPEDFEGNTIELTAVAKPKAEGRTNIPQTRTFTLDVSSPPGFPTIGKAKVGNITGTGTSTITIPIIGSLTSAGNVCITTGAINSRPTEYSEAGVSLGAMPKKCIRVPAGAKKELTVDLNVTERGRGRVEGQFQFEIKSAQSTDRVVKRTADFSMRIIPVADATTEWVLRVLLILVGVLIPLLIMYANKLIGARYVQSESLRRVTIPMLATADGTTPSPDWDDELGEDWLRGEKHAPPAASGFEFGRKMGISPFTAGKATVVAPGSTVVIGSNGSVTGRAAKADEPTGVIDFGLRGSWALRLNDPKFPDGTAVDDPHAMPESAAGELVAFITDREEFDRVLDDVDFKATAEYVTHDWTTDLTPKVVDIVETIDLSDPPAGSSEPTDPWGSITMTPASTTSADTAGKPAAEEPDDPFNF